MLVCADDVYLLANNVDTINKSTETLIDAAKEVGLEVNKEKTKYIFQSRYRNAGQNHDITIADRCFENVAQFRYLGTTVTNKP
jgi:ABC-type siderophore export system fused ATPase/permease subunit